MYGLGGSTNLSDKFPWGLWIGFDVMCGVGLAAGGFTLVAMVHIFNIKRYKPVLRPAILTAFLGYMLVVVGLLYDLGRPDRLWHPLVMWNPHSVMFEVAWCVTLYTTVLFLEFLPVVFEKFGLHKPLAWIHRISVPLMILGVLLSTLHQSSLGSLFLIVPEKLYPLWYTPILPLLFFISSIAVGLAMTIFESWHSSRAFGRALEVPLLASMARVLAVVMSVYLWIRFLDLSHRHAFGLLARNRTETWLFALEIALMAVPTVLLYQARIRRQPGRAVRLRGDGGVRLHRQPAERGHHRPGSGRGHALFPEVERGRGDAVDRGRGIRDFPRRSRSTSPSSRRTRTRAAADGGNGGDNGGSDPRRGTDDDLCLGKNPAGTGRQAGGLRDREHGGLFRSVRLHQSARGTAPIGEPGGAIGRPHHRRDPAQHPLRNAAQRPRGAATTSSRIWAASRASSASASSTSEGRITFSTDRAEIGTRRGQDRRGRATAATRERRRSPN